MTHKNSVAWHKGHTNIRLIIRQGVKIYGEFIIAPSQYSIAKEALLTAYNKISSEELTTDYVTHCLTTHLGMPVLREVNH